MQFPAVQWIVTPPTDYDRYDTGVYLASIQNLHFKSFRTPDRNTPE
jgi:hypothetical protein